ncbi:hypothetical protein HAHE_19660 [Haloferula helveola]|uniref:Uncharacterized protein n=1 Tax=Haloferula helveola TaxID=490095 RepID=A0ABM7R9T3_9BACT|nr:hypothetical protein HAHE_19660 [Haloferula helveola]
MFFRLSDLEPRTDYAGFKRCLVTRVNTRSMAPFGSVFPAEEHREIDVIVVCGRWQKPNEEWIEIHGGSAKRLSEFLSYGFMSYWDTMKPNSFYERMPAEGFGQIPGFESWSREKVEAYVQEKKVGLAPFMMPLRLIFNQAKGSVSFDFEYRLDLELPDRIFSVDYHSKGKGSATFVSPRSPGPGVLTAADLPSGPSSPPVGGQPELWWIQEGRLAGMPVPNASEIESLSAAGIRAIVTLGAPVDAQACDTAGIRVLELPEPDRDQWEAADEPQILAVAELCRGTQGAVAVCSNDHAASGTILGVALLADGVPVDEAIARMELDVPTKIESMAQMEFLYDAAAMLGMEMES